MKGFYDAGAHSPAAPERIWALLVDARSWPRWGTVDELVTEKSTNISSDGHDEVGAVRAFRTGRTVTSERIVGLEPGRLFAYAGAENPYLRDYRAEIRLSPATGGGTSIRWHGTYDVPFGMHLVMRPLMHRTMRRMVEGLARAA
ncbi:SRPBCC family protein [Actinoplanes sp. RD1]|uniref:SRPBCC family protein n=1 Tax=Actinoplanes sp. RD1 TaxID=3064538 RepID=UPI0027427B1B|nr:SRPBCC family protein [Actinoplanes sp. RD1]